MKRLNICQSVLTLICLFCLQHSFAQVFHTERIFVAPAKESCMPGDTLSVSGQLFAPGNPEYQPYSRYIYLECIDQKDSLLLRQKITCDEKGYFYAAIPTSPEWRSNICYLRAYTRLMQNYSAESFAIAPFLLGTTHPKKEKPAREIHSRFFPEGGRFVNGFQQNTVFQLTDDDGFPVSTTQAFLLNEKNDTIIHDIPVSENGLGKLTFQPETDKQYQLQAEYDGRFFTFPLKLNPAEATLQAVINRNRLSCRILSNEEGSHYRLFLYHSGKGLQEIPFHTEQKIAAVNLSDYPTGALTLFLTDSAFNLLSERILWQESPEEKQIIFNCLLPQTTVSPQDFLKFQLDIPQNSSVFVRIARQHDLLATQAYPALWLGGDIISPVRFPFINSQQTEELNTELNHWLYTARFVLFSPETILKEGMAYQYPIEDGLFLSGKAWKNKDKPFGPGLIDVQNTKDFSFYTGEIDKEGNFILPVDNYPDGTGFLLTGKNNKGKKTDCSFTLSEEIYPEINIPNPLFLKTQLQTDIILGDTSIRYSIDENEQRVYHIDNVTVQTHKKVDFREMNRNPNNYIDEETLAQRSGQSIRSLLNRFTKISLIMSKGSGSGEVGLLQKAAAIQEPKDREKMEREYNELTIVWKSAKYSSLSGGNTPLNIVVNGEPVFGNIEHILQWNAGDIKSIELIEPKDSRSTIYNTPNGAIAIETLKTPRTYEDRSQGETVYPFGLTITDKQPEKHIKAPSQPGKYRLLIDVITDDRKIVSFNKEFEVK